MSLLPAELFLPEQVQELDRRALETIPALTLMQRAAAAVYKELQWRWPNARRICFLCGAGNNGGDGLLAAALAQADGLDVSVLMACDPAALQGTALQARQRAEQAGLRCEPFVANRLERAEVIVDALLGIGLSRLVEGIFRDAILAINQRQQGARVLAVDIPSGLDAARGVPRGVAVEADVTVSFIGLKLGLFTGEGAQYCGRLVFNSLQVPSSIYTGLIPAARRITDEQRRTVLPPRRRGAHKGSHGHVLLVGGDEGMAGAIHLAAEAALRSGAGLVSVGTRRVHAALITQTRPELMCRGIEQLADLKNMLERTNVLAIGPGLGQGEWGRVIWEQLKRSVVPMVVDADALNLLARKPEHRANWVLTPHPGEAARLLDCSVAEIQCDRPAAVAALAQRYGGVAVLKGAGTLVKAEHGELQLCDAGNPGMASGGMGDLLCGVIAGLLAQGLSLENAAAVGVQIHARAGDLAAAHGGERGLLASDLLLPIRELANP